jgi:ribosome recycling factor
VRRQARPDLEALEKDGDLSRDELDRAEKELEGQTQKVVAEIDELLQHKEQELLEV